MADGSKQSARQLYGCEEQVLLPGKVHILSNFMPSFCGQDKAIADRLIVIRYTKRFVDAPNAGNPRELKKDPALVADLKDDRDATGTWLCIGAQMALADIKHHKHICVPQSVLDDTAAEIRNMDILSTFVSQHVEVCPQLASGTARIDNISRLDWSFDKNDLWQTFKGFLVSTGCEEKYDSNSFNAAVERYFANDSLTISSFAHGGAYFWLGIRRAGEGGRRARRPNNPFDRMSWENPDRD